MSRPFSHLTGLKKYLFFGIILLILTLTVKDNFEHLKDRLIQIDAPPETAKSMPVNSPDPIQYKYIDPKTGYRMGHYRAPTPPALKGVQRVSTAELATLRQKPDTLLIDVMAHTGAGWDPLTGVWLVSKTRLHIPGSIWLPDVGAGYLSNELHKYFKSNIERLTNGNKSRPLVIYCQSDCWMSWNAARRLRNWGYNNLYWYPEGHDGWIEADHKLVKANPIPLDIE